MHRAVVSCGASIDAINTVRKHISAVKGGRLAVAAHNATKVTLAVSDVPAGKESALASGPTLPDPTTIADFDRVIAHHELWGKFPRALQKGIGEQRMPETPEANDLAFPNSHCSLLLAMYDLLHAAHPEADAK